MYRSVLLLIAVTFFSSFSPYSSQDETSEVMQTAKKGMYEYLSKIPDGRKNLYGFSTDDNLQLCTVGKPLRFLTLTKAFYQDAAPMDITAVTAKNEWRVPVMLNGNFSTLLTVAGDDHNYNVVDLGGAVLARELQQKIANVPSGDSYFILRVYPLAADFFVHAVNASSIEHATFIPLTSAMMAMPELSTEPSYTLPQVLSAIRLTLQKHPKN